MNVRLLLLPAVVLLLLVGCRRDPYMQVYIDNMNAEKRLLEDTLYDLQYDYDAKVAEVEKLRTQLADLKSGESSVLTPGSDSGSSREGEAPRDLFPQIPGLNIDQGTPRDATPQGKDGKTLEGGMEMDDIEPPPLEGPPELDLGEDGPVSALPMPLDQEITRLVLDAALTGGLQHDQQPGDDGIRIVFQPRNDNQDFIRKAGRVSVVLLDPESRQRVAQWEFTEQQTALALQKTPAGRGIELNMPWQNAPPSQSRLQLVLRYWRPDGKTLEADQEIAITPNGQSTARWTPRTQQRPDPPSRRLNIADRQKTSPAPDRAADRPPQDQWEAASERDTPQPGARQAQLPQWRPYR